MMELGPIIEISPSEEEIPLKKANSIGGQLSYAKTTASREKKTVLPVLNLSTIETKDKKQIKVSGASTMKTKPALDNRRTTTQTTSERDTKGSSPSLPPIKRPAPKKSSVPPSLKSSVDALPNLATKRVSQLDPKSKMLTKSKSNSSPQTPRKGIPVGAEPSGSVHEELKNLPVIFRDFSLAGMGLSDTTNALVDPTPPALKTIKTKTQTISTKTGTSATAPSTAQSLRNNRERRKTVSVSKVSMSPISPRKPSVPIPKLGDISPRVVARSAIKSRRLDTAKSEGIVPSSIDGRSSSGPWTPANLLKLYKEKLSLYEQKEVQGFPDIYFYGPNASKIKALPNTNGSSANNNGYDDDQGDYKIVLNDHIVFRYEVQGILGKGTFGQVVKILDHKTGKSHALKIIRNRSRYHQQATVEAKILDYMKLKDPQCQSNIIQTITSFYFRNHFCIMFDLLSINLYDFIKANHFKGFTNNLVRKFAVQMLNSLKFLAKHHIIHCDLKPENILLNVPTKSAITVIDFGSSCFEHEKAYTYIQSRFYRAPEVILGIPYTVAIDMWSLACILAELYTGIPIFPGESELDQLGCIMELLGVPPQNILDQSTRKKYFFSNGRPRIVENNAGVRRQPGSKSLEYLLATQDGGAVDPEFASFISDCLHYNPKERMTPSQGLQHPWILQGELRKDVLEKEEEEEMQRCSSAESNGYSSPVPVVHELVEEPIVYEEHSSTEVVLNHSIRSSFQKDDHLDLGNSDNEDDTQSNITDLTPTSTPGVHTPEPNSSDISQSEVPSVT